MSRWNSLRRRFEEMDEEFFRDLFRKPAEVGYDYHPSERVLRAYLSGALGDEWHLDRESLPKLRRADLNGDWGLSEVSLHLLTCSHCAARAAQLRKEEVASFEKEARAERGLLSWLRAWVKGRRGKARLAEQPVGISIPGLLPVILDPSMGLSILSSVHLSLFQQRLHSGL